LTSIEKKWISFQLLTALRDSFIRGISHGDIKSSNILVTSWNWVYLTDFSMTYKPTHLPLNDPADFSFYYDTGGRRTCYVAPERFYEGKKDANGEVKESMDVFSAGCVIAELWLDGEAVFTLSSMFKYRSGETNLDYLLEKIQDDEVQVSSYQVSDGGTFLKGYLVTPTKDDPPRSNTATIL
jgi:phosphoinositide-3-kinase regulatory subunit 4